MKKNILFSAFIISSFFLRSQNFIMSPYCTGNFNMGCAQPGPANFPGNFVNDFINSFMTIGASYNISNINSGCLNLGSGFIHYCNKPLGTFPGEVITCSVQTGNFFQNGIAIFIDWNQDNGFNLPSELVAYSGVIAGGTWTTMTFTVPISQPNGFYRLRARCVYATPGNFINPCNFNNAGETEDYPLYVGIPPAGPAIINTAPASFCAGQSVTLTATGAPSYTWNNGNISAVNVVTPNPSGLYYVASPSPNNCVALNGVSLTTVPPITVSANSSAGILCLGNSATLTANGANNYTWLPSGSGSSIVVTPTNTITYTVIGSSGACSDTAQVLQYVFFCINAGVKENGKEEMLEIYPNPFSEKLIFRSEEEILLNVTDALGKLVYSKKFKGQVELDTHDWVSGTYFVQAGTKDSVKKFILTKP